MPMYDYQCEANGEIIEVVHGMSVKFSTWGELCEHAGRDLGDTPADTPVTRLVGGGSAILAPKTWTKTAKANAEASKSINHGATVAPMRDKNW